jgi:hypothetical protein
LRFLFPIYFIYYFVKGIIFGYYGFIVFFAYSSSTSFILGANYSRTYEAYYSRFCWIILGIYFFLSSSYRTYYSYLAIIV